MMNKDHLIDIFPSWMTDGLFANLGEWTPWEDDDDVDKNALDIEYFGNRSGERYPSPLLLKMSCNADGFNISETNMQRLDAIFRAKYAKNWKRLWDALELEYNPIENYNSVEIETPNLDTVTNVKQDVDEDISTDTSLTTKTSHASDFSNVTSGGTTETITPNTTETITENQHTDNTKHGILPIGGNALVDVEGDTSNMAQKQTTNKKTGSETRGLVNNNLTNRTTGTAQNNYDETVVTGNGNNNKTSRHIEANEENNFTRVKQTGNRRLERSGNIGVTTTQQMLESEYELRKKNFFDAVFNDVDTVLTSPYWRLNV